MRSLIVCFLFCFGLVQAQAAEYRSEEKFGLRVDIPNRWGHTVPTTDGTANVLKIEDSRNEASCYFVTIFPRYVRHSSLRGWVETAHIPGFVKNYYGNSNYTVASSREGQVKLGGGMEATFILQTLSNESSRRSAIFLFWETEIQNKKVWNYARCASKTDIELVPDAEPMVDLLSGIKSF